MQEFSQWITPALLRLDGVDRRLDGVEKHLDEVDKRFDETGQRFDEVVRELGGQRERMASSPWLNPASHRDGRRARLTRREEGAYWPYATDEQRSAAGMRRPSNAAGLLPRTARLEGSLEGFVAGRGDRDAA